jgi:KAP-like P-loop domain-containing protein
MADAGSITARFGFDPGAYESVRLDGLLAYEQLARVVAEIYPSDASQEQQQTSSASASASAAADDPQGEIRREVARAMPPPFRDLPLRTLIALANSARSGLLEHWYNEPRLRDGQPASKELRDWLDDYNADFGHYFPEQLHGQGLPDPVHWHQRSGDAVWPQIKATSMELAASQGKPVSAATALYVVLRDYPVELDPMLSDQKLAPDTAVDIALERAEDESRAPGLEEVEGQLERLRSGMRGPESPGLVLLSLLTLPNNEFADEFLILLDVERIAHVLEEEDAADVEPSRGKFSVQSRVVSDLPSRVDLLGIQPLVMGLHALLCDPATTLPLAIGVTAPWGGGKSSLMWQLRDELEKDGGGDGRAWIPVRFDAWKYERSERLWAALGKAIYEQPQEDWGWWESVRFKARLQWARSGGTRFWALPLALLGLLVVAAVLLALFASSALPAVAVGIAAVLAASDWLLRVSGLVGHPFKRALDRYTSRPRYDDQLGFTSEANEDISSLVKVLTRDKRAALAVFVDDLDRCSPAHLVEVIEAINQIFNSAEDRPCVFVLGMDRDVVAAGIEVAYGETTARLGDRGENFGYDFLAKVVQLSVALPPPSTEGLTQLLEAITGEAEVEQGETSADGAEEAARAQLRRELDRAAPTRLADVEAAARRIDAGTRDGVEEAELKEEVSAYREGLLGRDSAEVAEAEAFLVRFLHSNPREVKRFDNAFRLQLHVANRTPGCKLDFDLNDLIALGKWVVLRLRWPGLAAAIDRDPQLLEEMEKKCNTDDLWSGPTPGREWLDKPAVRALLTEENAKRRVARLGQHTFLRVS